MSMESVRRRKWSLEGGAGNCWVILTCVVLPAAALFLFFLFSLSFFSFFSVSSLWHKSGQMKMSRSRFILQRGFDCHVRAIDCSKDRGKSRNVITVLLRVGATAGQSMRSKKGYWFARGKKCSLRQPEWSGGKWQRRADLSAAPMNYPIFSRDGVTADCGTKKVQHRGCVSVH